MVKVWIIDWEKVPLYWSLDFEVTEVEGSWWCDDGDDDSGGAPLSRIMDEVREADCVLRRSRLSRTLLDVPPDSEAAGWIWIYASSYAPLQMLSGLNIVKYAKEKAKEKEKEGRDDDDEFTLPGYSISRRRKELPFFRVTSHAQHRSTQMWSIPFLASSLSLSRGSYSRESVSLPEGIITE